MRQKSYGFSIALLLSIIMPIDLYAKYITADEFTNAYDYFKGYEYDFQVDSIFYTFHDQNSVYVSAEYCYCDSFLSRPNIPSYAIVKTSYHGVVKIPETVTFDSTVFTVAGINSAAFRGCENLNQVIIPNSVKEIGLNAFQDCKNLDVIGLPEGINVIGDYAFSGCAKLTRISLPKSLTGLNDGTFKGCSNLWCVFIPKSVSRLQKEVFSGCVQLKRIYITSSQPIRCIDDEEFGSFYGVNKTQCTIYVPSNGMENYKKADVWNTFFNIEENPLLHSDITDSRINYEFNSPNTLSIVDAQCDGYANYSIPTSAIINDVEYSVTGIENYAFANNKSLLTVVFPEGLTSIGEKAFYGCTDILSITLPYSITEIGDWAFYDCKDLASLYIFNDNPYSIRMGVNVFRYEYNCNLYVPDKSLDDYNCLTPWNRFKQVLPSGICQDGLTYKILSEEKKTAVLIRHHNNQEIINIPSTIIYNEEEYSVVAIKDSAFYMSKYLTSITIPSSVETIGKAAFAGCSNLKEVELPNSLPVIEEEVFMDCSSLENISLPMDLKQIGICSFSGCSELRSLYLPDSLERIECGAFDGCTGLKILSIPASVSYINPFAFQSCDNIDTIFWNSPNVLPDECIIWRCNYSLKYISLGNEINKIPGSMFSSCVNLTSISIPKNVEYIGPSAFFCCKNLKEIVIEGSPVIYEHAFAGCNNIDTIVFKSQTPPTAINYSLETYGFDYLLYDDWFPDVIYEKAVLSIPEGSFDEYMASDIWSRFSSLYLLFDKGYESDFENDTIYYAIQGSFAFVGARVVNLESYINIFGYDGPLTPRDPDVGGLQPRTSKRSRYEGTEVDTSGDTSYRGNIIIPESVSANDTIYAVTGIKYFAFMGSEELESVSIPESVKQLGYGSFAGCSGLKTVNIPCGITMIPNALFYGCSSIERVEIPERVLTIGKYAFYDCSGLTEIIIPAGVELIDRYAFAYCSNLKRVVIEGDPVIAETAFLGCGTELEVISTRVETIEITDFDSNVDGEVHYSIDGRMIPADFPGLHIIKYRNGTVRKAVVR
ncbi:MAG: leucine-rich repeat domain-containing protein [Bacteroidaceae bacterium]|nr:leucine-rich repeat domain-containing protein [Bacteroidaceae bacterium]